MVRFKYYIAESAVLSLMIMNAGIVHQILHKVNLSCAIDKSKIAPELNMKDFGGQPSLVNIAPTKLL